MSGDPRDFDPNRQGHPSEAAPYPPPPQWTRPEDTAPPAAHYPPASQYPYPVSYPPPASYPPAATYPPTPPADHAYPPPPPGYPPPAGMNALQPPAAGYPYQLPPPPGAPRPDPYAQPQVVYQAAAPRQRTAIACRYCRRRKIRCSGFESSRDGRCSNCIRFNQECMFTPVSSQTQAFVPAHAAFPHLRNPQNQGRGGPPQGVMLYGAHGQPLPPQQQPQPPDSTLPPPQGMYPPQGYYGHPPPPTSHAEDPRMPGRRGSGGWEYPDPTNLAPVTPASSVPPVSQTYTVPSPYYPPPPDDRRPSPHASYSYDGRHSSSPHNSPHPAMQHTPPPTSTPGGGRAGLNVRDMLNPGGDDGQGGGRSSTDSDMLNALNRRGLGQ